MSRQIFSGTNLLNSLFKATSN